MPSLQYDRHYLHCALDSVSNNSGPRCPRPESLSLTSYWTGCWLCFVVDLVEEIVGEGGSRSSWGVHEHDSSQLVSQQNVAIRVFWSRCQPRLTLIARDLARDLCHGKQRVSSFCHDLFQRWSSCFHEKNVFGRHLARDLCHGKQWVSPFNHDLDLELVGSVGNF